MRHILPQGFKRFVPLIAALDFLCFQLSLYLGYLLWINFPWHGNYQYFSDFVIVLWVLPPVAVLVFTVIQLYKPEMGVIGVQEQSLIFKGIWIAYASGFAISFFYRDVHFSRLAVFYSIFISIVLISIERYWVRRCFQWLCLKGIATRPALIYGAGYHGQRLHRWIKQSPQLGINVIGYLDDNTDHLQKLPEDLPVLGKSSDLEKFFEKQDIAMLFIAHRTIPEEEAREIFFLCRKYKVSCWAIPSLFEFHVERVELQNIGGIPLLGFRDHIASGSYIYVKRILDIVISLVLLTLMAPLMLVIAIVLKLTSKEELIFKQNRVGKNSKPFCMYKFRTLIAQKDDAISPELQKDGNKIDPFRHFLRVSGLDEVPQLFNVLKGEMSLVGPRPEMPFLVEKYGSLERERLTVDPGITGLWQISDDRKRLLIHENMDYDLYYMENMSFNLDLAILLKTFFAVLKRIFPFKK